MPKDRKWLCENESCRALLGFIDETLNQVRIKYKDLYVSVEGGRVVIKCRRCARDNELTDQDYLLYLNEKYAKETAAKEAVAKKAAEEKEKKA